MGGSSQQNVYGILVQLLLTYFSNRL